MPLISVLVPAYNAGPYLAQALDSVLAQTVEDWECIIVDDASTDDTAAVAQRYVQQDKRFILHRISPSEKKPHPASREVALSLATGEWISPLDGDDWWEPWKLQKQLDAVHARPGIVLCTCAAWHWTDGKITGRNPHINPDTVGRDMLIQCVSAHSVLAKRQAVIDAGGYDLDMLIAEDWDLWCRMSLKFGFENITGLDEPGLFYRRHVTNITSNNWRNIYYDRKLVYKLLFKEGLLWRYPRIAIKLYDTNLVRAMNFHMLDSRWWWARLKAIQLIAMNPLRKWRWQYARRAWRRMPPQQSPASQ